MLLSVYEEEFRTLLLKYRTDIIFQPLFAQFSEKNYSALYEDLNAFIQRYLKKSTSQQPIMHERLWLAYYMRSIVALRLLDQNNDVRIMNTYYEDQMCLQYHRLFFIEAEKQLLVTVQPLIKKRSPQVEKWTTKAMNRYGAKDFLGAVRAWEKVLELDATCVQAYRQLLSCHVNLYSDDIKKMESICNFVITHVNQMRDLTDDSHAECLFFAYIILATLPKVTANFTQAQLDQSFGYWHNANELPAQDIHHDLPRILYTLNHMQAGLFADLYSRDLQLSVRRESKAKMMSFAAQSYDGLIDYWSINKESLVHAENLLEFRVLAVNAYYLGRYADALHYAEKLLAYDRATYPDLIQAQQLSEDVFQDKQIMMVVQMQLKQYDQAIQIYQEYIDSCTLVIKGDFCGITLPELSRLAKIYFHMGICHIYQKDYHQAVMAFWCASLYVHSFNQCMLNNPSLKVEIKDEDHFQHEEILILCVRMLVQLNYVTNIQKELESVSIRFKDVHIPPDIKRIEMLLRMSQAWNIRNYQELIESIDRQIKSNRELYILSYLWGLKAYCYLEVDNVHEAISCFEHAEFSYESCESMHTLKQSIQTKSVLPKGFHFFEKSKAQAEWEDSLGELEKKEENLSL